MRGSPGRSFSPWLFRACALIDWAGGGVGCLFVALMGCVDVRGFHELAM